MQSKWKYEFFHFNDPAPTGGDARGQIGHGWRMKEEQDEAS